MPSVADLVEGARLQRLAAPGTLAEGRQLVERGAVRITQFAPQEVVATVADGNTVELRADGEELTWSCTCPAGSSADLCEHAVAVALETWRRSPTRGR